ncbi:MAG TPA: KH domain-containing protein [Elusimicrobiota bacterium]|nr:KH domain-containing protein [Elusimicrobiota bacterium]
MKALAEFLVKNLAELPEAAEVDAVNEDDTVRLTVRVADDDKGRVIGRQGKVIRAIRSVVDIAAAKAGSKAVVEVE